MKVLFRFDFGGKVGLGHLSRCKAIADALVKQGHEVFACGHNRSDNIKYRDNVPHFISDQIPFIALKGRPNSRLKPSDLLLQEREDAEETRRLGLLLKIDLVFVDHYGIGNTWFKFFQGDFPMVAISDGTQFSYVTQIIDYGFNASLSNYAEPLATGIKVTLGSIFAPVSQDYSRFNLKPSFGTLSGTKCLVSLGGSSSSRDLYSVQKLIRIHMPSVNFLESIQYPHHESTEKTAPPSRINVWPVSLADRFASADFAVVSAGVTMYDMLASGALGLVLVTAENQRPAFDAARLGGYVREFNVVDPEAQLVDLARELSSPDSRINAWLAGRSVVDDLGAKRIATEVLPRAKPTLELRKFAPQDSPILFRLRNQSSSIQGFFTERRVTTSEHLSWFDEHMSSDNHGFIFEVDGLPVGQCRLTASTSNGGYNLSYSILEEYQGRGLSAKMLAALFAKFDSPKPVWAHVKPNNSASIAVLRKCSFERYTSNSEKVVMVRWNM